MPRSKSTPSPERPAIALAAALAIAFTAACAATSTSAAAPDTTPEVLVDQDGRVYRTTDAPAATSLAASPDSTFRAVLAAYTALGLEPSTIDPAGRVVARQHMLLRSRFQGEPLSAVFDCGAGQFGPRADQGRITADIATRIIATGTGSSMSTMIQASLVPNDGASRDPIRCVSHGRIEERLRREVTLNLGLPYGKS
ncbi:MAG TPA: hypothetical protein VG432_14220 [Gemmatimonadaceae bacterium]|nr:hypothetical protein [Gemmatimonadaceae bacterium]